MSILGLALMPRVGTSGPRKPVRTYVLARIRCAIVFSFIALACTREEETPPNPSSSPTRARPMPARPRERPRTPTVLARLKGHPKDLAVDDKAVYVTEEDWEASDDTQSSIVRIPLDGGEPTALATRQRGGQSVVVAKDFLYWIRAGNGDLNIPDPVVRLPVRGGKQTIVASTFLFADAALVTDGIYLYFGQLAERNGHLMRLAIGGGKAERVATYGNDEISVIAVDQANAFWLSLTTIVKAPVTGGPVTELVKDTGVGNVWGMATDGRHLYFTDRNNWRSDAARTGAIRRIRIDGGSVETLARGLPGRPWGIAVDDTHVYAVINMEPDGGIVRLSKEGGPASVFVSGQASPVHLATDRHYVYWCNASDGIVAKAPKQ